MGGISGDHIAHQNCEKRRAWSFSGEAQYLCVFLRFGLEVNKDVLAFLYRVSTIQVVVDEFTTVNSQTNRIGEKRHRRPLQGNGVMPYRIVDHDFNMLSIKTQPRIGSWRSEIRNCRRQSPEKLALMYVLIFRFLLFLIHLPFFYIRFAIQVRARQRTSADTDSGWMTLL